MHEKSPQPLWRLHLSTGLTIMLMSAFLVGCNFTRAKKLFIWPEGVYSTYGWPFDVCLLRHDTVIQWNYGSLALNALAGLLFIALAGSLCEWFTRFQRTRRTTFNHGNHHHGFRQ
jgi:hypothetical protein